MGSLVFVVDDDASVRKSLDRLLSAAGYRVQTFESARAFLAIRKSHVSNRLPAS